MLYRHTDAHSLSAFKWWYGLVCIRKVALNAKDFEMWDKTSGGYVVEPGNFTLYVGCPWKAWHSLQKLVHAVHQSVIRVRAHLMYGSMQEWCTLYARCLLLMPCSTCGGHQLRLQVRWAVLDRPPHRDQHDHRCVNKAGERGN